MKQSSRVCLEVRVKSEEKTQWYTLLNVATATATTIYLTNLADTL